MLVTTSEVVMQKKYVVTLPDAERTQLRTLLRKGQHAARTLTRAQVLVLADEGQADEPIARTVHVTAMTVHRLRKRYCEDGLAATLGERPRPGATPKLDGKQEAFLVALACSEPPEDRPTWTMQLLADRLVAIGVVDTISDETVRRVLKKTTSSHG